LRRRRLWRWWLWRWRKSVRFEEGGWTPKASATLRRSAASATGAASGHFVKHTLLFWGENLPDILAHFLKDIMHALLAIGHDVPNFRSLGWGEFQVPS
jgi:hypothetical protein